jgi:hypothetical protein
MHQSGPHVMNHPSFPNYEQEMGQQVRQGVIRYRDLFASATVAMYGSAS